MKANECCNGLTRLRLLSFAWYESLNNFSLLIRESRKSPPNPNQVWIGFRARFRGVINRLLILDFFEE